MVFLRNKRIAIAANDAGGANQLYCLLKNSSVPVAKSLLDGPAQTIFRDLIPAAKTYNRLVPSFFDGIDLLLSATSWSSNLEHLARREAKRSGVFSVSILDHWVNYRQRFSFSGEQVFPDELIVVDDYAKKIAVGEFPGMPVHQVPDFYLQSILDGVGRSKDGAILYVLEPARSDWGLGIPGEFQALEFFLSNYHLLRFTAGARVLLRAHPSDPPGKYDFIRMKHPEIIIEPDVESIQSSMSKAQWVIGCNTYAMVIGCGAGRNVLCSLPPWAPRCVLPHQGIRYLSDLIVGKEE